MALMREHHITGWRRGSNLTGKPDFIFPTKKVAVFVDGCFWHGCPRHRRLPKSRVSFWKNKLTKNVTRDRKVSKLLRSMGWTVLRIWECALARNKSAKTLSKLTATLEFNAVKGNHQPVACHFGSGVAK
jgi:DNA mismatch endonuclease (patch repair protein)